MFSPAVICDPYGTISNGRINGAEHGYNKTLIVQCAPGYYLEGAATLRCSGEGTWMGDVDDSPLCIGKFSTIHVHLYDNRGIFFSKRLVCRYYYLEGASTLPCSGDGTWVGDVDESPLHIGKIGFMHKPSMKKDGTCM